MRIAILGAGNVGQALGASFVKAGHSVVYGSRDPSGRAAPHAGSTIDSLAGAVASAEIAVLATPWAAAAEAVAQAGDFAGKALIDATNPIGPGFALALGHTTSGAESLAAHAKNAKLVKGFNTTGFENMKDPRYGERRALMPLCGDDEAALAQAAQLARDIGFDVVALPGLVRARELEPLAMLWIKLALAFGQGRDITFGLSRRTARRPASPRPTAHKETITVLGAGNIGGALARAWLASGHSVRIAARDAASEDVRALAALGAQVAPIDGAAEGSDVVVLATPWAAALDAAKRLGSLEGKVVIDCTNAIGKGFTLQFGHTTSSAEELAKALPGAKVVRAFHQQGAEVLECPTFEGLAATNFVAADDADARALVRRLSDEVGLDSVEAGPLSSARLLEPVTLFWIATSRALGTREIGLSLLRR